MKTIARILFGFMALFIIVSAVPTPKGTPVDKRQVPGLGSLLAVLGQLLDLIEQLCDPALAGTAFEAIEGLVANLPAPLGTAVLAVVQNIQSVAESAGEAACDAAVDALGGVFGLLNEILANLPVP